jgi:hypothetical protein
MSEEKELELDKIRREIRSGNYTSQDELLFVIFSTLGLPSEMSETLVAEHKFQTRPFKVGMFVQAVEGEEPEEEPLSSWRGDVFAFSPFITVKEAVEEVLKTAMFNGWFSRMIWYKENATVWLLPGLETSLTELMNAKTLYDRGEYKIAQDDKLINHVKNILSNAKLKTILQTLKVSEPLEF